MRTLTSERSAERNLVGVFADEPAGQRAAKALGGAGAAIGALMGRA